MTIPAEKMASYRQGLRRKLSRPLTGTEQAELDKARAEAKRLAQALVKEHKARRVWLFGSVACRRPLRADSDIDLAVEGMSPDVYYSLVGDLHSASGRLVDLIRLESARWPIKRIILLEGVILAGGN